MGVVGVGFSVVWCVLMKWGCRLLLISRCDSVCVLLNCFCSVGVVWLFGNVVLIIRLILVSWLYVFSVLVSGCVGRLKWCVMVCVCVLVVNSGSGMV